VERYSYDVFSEPNRTSDANNPYLFTGRSYDTETGLYYYRARYYAYDIGRFLQTDPEGFLDGLNLYTYVGSNPLNWQEPYGLLTVSLGGGWGLAGSVDIGYTAGQIRILLSGGLGAGGFVAGQNDNLEFEINCMEL
jgi:RHS repeat-associated protein